MFELILIIAFGLAVGGAWGLHELKERLDHIEQRLADLEEHHPD